MESTGGVYEKEQMKAGIDKNENFGYLDIQNFQEKVFNGTHQILVFEQNSTIPFFKGTYVGEDRILVLYLSDGHYRGVRNVCPLLGSTYYCSICDTRCSENLKKRTEKE